jgi:hypothetical protein
VGGIGKPEGKKLPIGVRESRAAVDALSRVVVTPDLQVYRANSALRAGGPDLFNR